MEKLFSPLELAEHLGMALQTIYNRRHQVGALPKCINVGRTLRFRQSDVEVWLTKHYENNNSNANPMKTEISNSRPRGRPTKAEQVSRRLRD
jgi:predicted DNA-binding transcriptional regulator AlpA